MKTNYCKLIMMFCLILLSISGNSQNSLYLSYQPCDAGLGLRYDKEFNRAGFYSSVTKGNYRFNDDYVKDHYKASAGLIYDKMTIGLSYHKYGESKGEFMKLSPMSIEIGAKASFKWFVCALRFDPVKGEGTWDFGINF